MKIRSSEWNIPEEILLHILSHLPAKSVGQFRCVSKPWRALLTQPEFIRAHLHRSKSRQQSLLLFDRYSRSLFYTSLNNAHNVFDEITLSWTKLNSTHLPYSWPLLGTTCDGLLLFSKYRDEFVLMNPITREIRQLPPPPFSSIRRVNTTYGLGYDSVRDDYKIVTLTCYPNEDCRRADVATEAFVYSLKTGSWTRVHESCPLSYLTLPFGFGTYVGGSINWIAHRRDEGAKRVILVFNLVDHKFTEMPLPKSVQCYRLLFYSMVLGRCLCLYNIQENHVWVMSEYGVHESWVKFRINDLECRPCCFLNQEQVLMVKNGSYVMYNLKQSTFKEVVTDGISNASNCVQDFSESLISPHGNSETRRG